MKKRILAALYGMVWAILAPAFLWWWCHRIPLSLPAVHVPLAGWLLTICGLCLWLSGVSRLRTEGGGLPMNAFPPPRLAVGGIYSIFPHPIYTGFGAAWVGMAFVTGSTQALWLGTPVLALVCLGLVWGHERPDLARRFPGISGPRPWIGIPAPGNSAVSRHERSGAMLAAVLPWLICYGGVKLLGAYPDAIETRMPWEWSVPIQGWTELIYSSPYLLVPWTFLLISDRCELRKLVQRSWLFTGIVTLVYLVAPFMAAFRPPQPGLFAQWLRYEQLAAWPPVASWPSFHVIWTLLVAQALAGRLPPWLRYGWATSVAITCLSTGMHSVADLTAALLLWMALRNPGPVWRRLMAVSERLANAWRCWELGPLRIISHGLWAGLAAAAGFLVVMSATAQQFPWPALLVFLCGLVCAGLWAQWVEGSAALSRPFGYYGAVLGAALGLALLALAGADWALLAGGFALAAAPIQALGRIRCLEQGCCHGHPVSWGIKVFNCHSRVVSLAGLMGVPLHPTALYSILGNLVSGLLLARLWALGAALTLVAGTYLMLAGVLRFVEEAYRGEPQTLRVAGLPLYQWLALTSFLAGMVLCLAPSAAAPGFHAPRLWDGLWALLPGLVCAGALGVDFPHSKWRFSRLSG